MANHYFGINDFELVKAMHEDDYDEFMEEHEEFQSKEWKVEKAVKMLNEMGLTVEDLK